MDYLTERQCEVYQASLRYPVKAEAARSIGMERSNYGKALAATLYRIAQKEQQVGPLKIHAPVNQNFKAQSALYDAATGEQKLVWLKTEKDEAARQAIIASFAESFLKPSQQVKIKAPTGELDTDLIPWIQIGDAHLGMLAYDKEVGHDFDMEICERELCTAIATLIDRLPKTERIVIQDMGDFTHYENKQGVTERSGHRLDCDGRYNRMIAVYADILRFICDTALAKFKFVDIILNQGNHSEKNDLWGRVFLQHVYENTKRLTILNNESVFIPYRMGNTFVLCHHSDKCRGPALAGVMANDFRQDFGETLYHYIDVGHVHHKQVTKENNGVTIESFNQLAPSDKYAHDGGWRSRQCITAVLRSKTYGEKGRIVLTAEEVKDMILRAPAGTAANARREVYTV